MQISTPKKKELYFVPIIVICYITSYYDSYMTNILIYPHDSYQLHHFIGQFQSSKFHAVVDIARRSQNFDRKIFGQNFKFRPQIGPQYFEL